MGVSTDALQRYIREENMPPFDAAVRLCKAAGVRLEWLASGEGEMRVDAGAGAGAAHVEGAQTPLRREILVAAIRLVDQVLGARADAPAPPKRAELLSMAYELLELGVPDEKVAHFLLVAAGQAPHA